MHATTAICFLVREQHLCCFSASYYGAAGDTAANNDAARNSAAGEANAVAKTSAAAAT